MSTTAFGDGVGPIKIIRYYGGASVGLCYDIFDTTTGKQARFTHQELCDMVNAMAEMQMDSEYLHEVRRPSPYTHVVVARTVGRALRYIRDSDDLERRRCMIVSCSSRASRQQHAISRISPQMTVVWVDGWREGTEHQEVADAVSNAVTGSTRTSVIPREVPNPGEPYVMRGSTVDYLVLDENHVFPID